MPRINYPSSSPYGATPQTSWYIANYVHRPIPAAGDDIYVTITKQYENRPDKLSFDQYGTPAYWWVFAVRNRNLIGDPIWDMTVGKTIVVPSLSTIQRIIGS